MDIYELKENSLKFYGNDASIKMDKDCIFKLEVMLKDGSISDENFVEYHCAKVSAPGKEEIVVSILPHREVVDASQALEILKQ